MTPPRPMTRYAALAHGLLTVLVLILPLLRLGWDPWAQTTVHLLWSFLIVLGSILLLLGRSGDFSRFDSAFRRMGLLWAVFLGASLCSTLLSPFPHSAFPAFLNDFPAVAFLLLALGSSEARRSLYARALAGAGTLAVVVALLFGGGATALWAGPLLNPNLLAALVLLTAPLALDYCFGPVPSKGVRWFWGVASLFLIGGLLVSRSLAGYGTALLQVALAVGILSRRAESRGKVIFVLLAGLCLLMGGGAFLVRSEWTKLIHGDPDRWAWAMTALRAFAAHPLLGVGPGAFGEAYPAYRASEWGLNSLFAHNFILEFLAERGLVGASALFLLMGDLLQRARHAVIKGARPGLYLGLVGFCFYNLFHIGFSFPALFWLFFLSAGLAGPREDLLDVGETPSPFLGALPSPACGRGRGCCLSVKLVSSSMVLWLLIGGASSALFRSSQCFAQARVSLSEDRWDQARDRVEKGLFWNRWSPELHELRAAVRMKAQNWDGAKADLDRAMALAPTSAEFKMESAELALERGDPDQALRDYESATRLMPLKTSAWERWGDLLAGRGRKEDAARAYSGALRALSDPRVLKGDAALRAERTRRVEEKKNRLSDAPPN